MATPKEVAQWMKQRIELMGELLPEDAVVEIERRFGTEFVYDNESGNAAIKKVVLAEFKKITSNVVWERSERYWRLRNNFDGPSRESE